jgi:hypothetical protein
MKMHPAHGRRRADAPSVVTLRRIGTFTGLAAAATGLAAAAVLPFVQAGSQDVSEDRSDFQASVTASSAVAASDEGTPGFSRSAVASEAAPDQAKESRPDAERQPPAGPPPVEEGTAPATAAARKAAAPATAAAQESAVPAKETAAPAERAVPNAVVPTEQTVRKKAATPAEPAPRSESAAPVEPPASGASPVPSDPATETPEPEERPGRDHPADGPEGHWHHHHWWGEDHRHRSRG